MQENAHVFGKETEPLREISRRERRGRYHLGKCRFLGSLIHPAGVKRILLETEEHRTDGGLRQGSMSSSDMCSLLGAIESAAGGADLRLWIQGAQSGAGASSDVKACARKASVIADPGVPPVRIEREQSAKAAACYWITMGKEQACEETSQCTPPLPSRRPSPGTACSSHHGESGREQASTWACHSRCSLRHHLPALVATSSCRPHSTQPTFLCGSPAYCRFALAALSLRLSYQSEYKHPLPNNIREARSIVLVNDHWQTLPIPRPPFYSTLLWPDQPGYLCSQELN